MLVLEYTKQVLQERGFEKLGAFMADDVIQHAPIISAGRDGMVTWLNSDAAGQYEMLFNIMGQGDFVVTYGKRHANRKDIAVFNVYRVAGDKIVEHWMNEEEISPRDTWGNSGKF
jgi:predicted SnoaL-like aldol condensation-catalyzing enzyme